MDLAYVATGAFDIWWEGGCWEWYITNIHSDLSHMKHCDKVADVLPLYFRDVAAGICLLKEAGGLITTANPPANIDTDSVQEARLGSRLYLAIR